MSLKDIRYELDWKYTDKYVYCPPHTTLHINDDEESPIDSRGARADVESLEYSPQNYVKPEDCHECEYKMYRVLGLVCPCEPPKYRRKSIN